MDVVNITIHPSVRRAGCVLLLMLVLSHGSALMGRSSNLSSSGLLRFSFIFAVIFIYWIRTHPGSASVVLIAVCRKLASWNQTISLLIHRLVVLLSRFISLPELTKEIVFSYTVGIGLGGNENKYVFAWIISLFGNHSLSLSIAMIWNGELKSLTRYFSLVAISGFFMSISLSYYSFFYTVTTLIYHCLCLEWFVNRSIIAVKRLDLDVFEGLEKFYLWIFTYACQFLMGLVCAFFLLFKVDFHFLTVTVYAPVILTGYIVCYPAMNGMSRFSAILFHYLRQLACFPLADEEEIVGMKGDVCAVCLGTMDTARRTPCRHYFHGKCLIRCLRHRSTCPMCKAELKFG